MILFVCEKCLLGMMVDRGNLFCLAVSFAVRMKNDIQKIVQEERQRWLYRKQRLGGDGDGVLCCVVFVLVCWWSPRVFLRLRNRKR